MKRMTIIIVMWTAAMLAACEGEPLDAWDAPPTPGPDVVGDQTPPASNLVKLDFLWVIDDSASMCRARNQLSRSIDQFLEVDHDVGEPADVAVVAAVEAAEG